MTIRFQSDATKQGDLFAQTGYLLDVLLPTDGKTLSWYSNAVAEDIERLLEERKEQYT